MWDERYSDTDYIYGTAPNTFLASAIEKITCRREDGQAAKVLSLADGEGRNGVFLAEQGCQVTAVDSSSVGLAKAKKLAASRGVEIETLHLDLADLAIEENTWDAVVSIFCHVPSRLREDLHRKVVAGLCPGGVLILEAYTPAQLSLNTGGPKDVDMTMSLEKLHKELAGLQFEYAVEKQRDVVEGKYHTGIGAVVQVIARKP